MSKRYSIVGVEQNNAAGIVASLPNGLDVILIREPDNPFDPLAVAVWANGQKIGYVPKKQNPPLAQKIDAAGTDLGMLAMDAKPVGSKYIVATFVRSPNSGFPMVQVSE